MLVVNMLWFQYPLTNWTIISGWVRGGGERLWSFEAMKSNGIYLQINTFCLLHVSLSYQLDSVNLNLSDFMNH